MSHDSIEVYSNGKTHRLLKLLFFIYKCAGILLTSIYITQWVLATPTLIGTWFYEYHWILLEPLTSAGMTLLWQMLVLHWLTNGPQWR